MVTIRPLNTGQIGNICDFQLILTLLYRGNGPLLLRSRFPIMIEQIDLWDMCCAWKTTGYQSKPHDGKWTRAPEDLEGRDRTGLTPYLEI